MSYRAGVTIGAFVMAFFVLIFVAGTLTSIRDAERYRYCIEAGGSWNGKFGDCVVEP